jgi:acyl-CoA reductase-like NAD-dependent aldehyde dehydrogenase
MDLKSRQLIAATWCKGDGADVVMSMDPVTEEVLSQFSAASVTDTEKAVAAASRPCACAAKEETSAFKFVSTSNCNVML